MEIQVSEKGSIKSSNDAARILKSILSAEPEIEREKEHFWAIGLNIKNQIKYVELVSLGTLTASLVHPRETFRMAVLKGIASLIVGHNHPSGDTTPSRDDLTITKRLKEAGEILGIKLIDHVIVTETEHKSLMEGGLI
ncbi:MAG: JAB domain-containing protein [Thermodesulfovibrionia bacterium]|nr:JAB domain-containing protein [Thermodesulfovibrionia bacterium]